MNQGIWVVENAEAVGIPCGACVAGGQIRFCEETIHVEKITLAANSVVHNATQIPVRSRVTVPLRLMKACFPGAAFYRGSLTVVGKWLAAFE